MKRLSEKGEREERDTQVQTIKGRVPERREDRRSEEKKGHRGGG